MVVFPHAKINIGLFVTGKRPDGFHNLETVFYPVGLSDMLEIGSYEAEEAAFQFKNTGLDVGCEPEKNLIVRAYRLLAVDFHLPAIQIHLHKLIPFGAGLGGGSADAAFMLRALNQYFELHLSGTRLMEYASCLGSDCPFFIMDKPAFARGKGELLEPLEFSLSDYRLVLVKPDFGVSTPEAYAGIRPQKAVVDLREINRFPVEEWKSCVRNDFEDTVFLKYPSLAALKQKMYAGGADFASMTGSGSAVYGLFKKGQKIDVEFPSCFVWEGDLA